MPASNRTEGSAFAIGADCLVLRWPSRLAATGVVSPERLRNAWRWRRGVLLPDPRDRLGSRPRVAGRSETRSTGIPLPVLIAVNAVRVLGYFFVIHYAAGGCPRRSRRAPAGATSLLGVTALPVALLDRAAGAVGWRPIAFVWNLVRHRRPGPRDRRFGVTSAIEFAAPDLHRRARHQPDGRACRCS